MQQNNANKIIFFMFGTEYKDILMQATNPSELQQQIEKSKNTKNQILSVGLQPNERQKLTGKNSFWYCQRDNHGFYYYLQSGQKYPERIAYKFIQELLKHLETLPNLETADETEIKYHCKSKVQELLQKYNDLASIDKVSEAEANLDQVRLQMNDNIHNMVGNQKQLDDLHEKSRGLQNAGEKLQKQSHDLERIMYYRNLKLKIMVALIVIGVLLIILIPIIGDGVGAIKGSDKDDSKNENSNQSDEASKSSSSGSRILLEIIQSFI
ncbi:Longin-like domain [Pseudocohnilembus persalinus]|uniref:Longin-like domain n=1 Tax=Pseudocohnilembus persalinus TaxID=266149 RepID=A0A0V0R3W9_PSEPJ|nr:Longin-like domain [Pseudocohnilembus persalinus]|eukprot:KRX09181.1 Longin-like domain [Pseudocohnilembus persalinus]